MRLSTPGYQAVCCPQASPMRTPGYLISWAMAPSLWPLAFWRSGLCLGRSPGLARGPGNGLKPKAPGHGNGSRPWLEAMAMALAPSLYPEKAAHGYWVWGIGYWVVGSWYRVVGIFILSNTLDARWVGGLESLHCQQCSQRIRQTIHCQKCSQ